MHRIATVQAKSNLHLTVRERGKIVARRAGHNIWLDLGREYLASLLAYRSMNPLAPERDDRIRYMGLGIGGTRQVALGVANAPPLAGAYPGSNLQNDTTPSVTRLERPVRISGSGDPYPGRAGDAWLAEVQAPAGHVVPTQVTFKRLFTQLDVSYPPFLSVPLSEIGLLTSAADAGSFANTLVAYDTFDTLSKTDAFELEVDWTVRF
jgi:hypothetical protein